MRVTLVDEFERVVGYYTDTETEQDKQTRAYNNVHRRRIRVFEADNEREHDNADDIVDYSGAHYQRTDVTFQMTELFERLHGYADGGGGHYGADEHGAHEVLAAEFAEPEDEHIGERAADERY